MKHYDSTGSLALTVDYRYDAFGELIQKDDGTYVTKYGVDGWNPNMSSPIGNENFDVWADLNGGSSSATRYLRGDVVDQILARIDKSGSTLKPYWGLTDHLGSVRDVIDNSGVVVDSLKYDSFGNIDVGTELDAAYRGRYTWTGREFDVETQLQFNRARYYDAGTGRWISQDPLGFDAGDSILSRYVYNSPTMATDSGGLQGGDGDIGLVQGNTNYDLHTKQNSKVIGKDKFQYIFVDVDPVIKKGKDVEKGAVVVGVVGPNAYIDKVSFAQFESIKVFQKKGGKWEQFNPGGISFKFPPKEKFAWKLPIDGSWVVDNKGIADEFMNYPGRTITDKNAKNGYGLRFMADAATSTKYIYGELKKDRLKDAEFKVTGKYVVLVYHDKKVIGRAEYSLTFDGNSQTPVVEGVGQVVIGNAANDDLDAINKVIERYKLKIK